MENILPDYGKNYKKFNSNFGFVNREEIATTLQAFSHWTHEHTNQYMIVVDLQVSWIKFESLVDKKFC